MADTHPLISVRDGAAGPRAALVGTRLDVAQVISTIRQNNDSVEQAADYLDLPVAHVEACVRYYRDHQDEIDAWLEAEAAAADPEDLAEAAKVRAEMDSVDE
jgi:uncharacterized protein (DUF433 family)